MEITDRHRICPSHPSLTTTNQPPQTKPPMEYHRLTSRSRSPAVAIVAVLAVVVCVVTAPALLGSSFARTRPMSAVSRSVSTRAQVGDIAPAFSLPSESGKKYSLANFKGPLGIEALSKPVVVFFYGGQGSPSCTKEAEAFAEAYPEIKAMGAEVLGISRDSQEFSQEWKAEKGLPFPLLSDEDGA
eukprot:539709-Amorphochlora_amoeboformis.AAC.1